MRLEPFEDLKARDGDEDSMESTIDDAMVLTDSHAKVFFLLDGVWNFLLKFTVEVIAVFNNFDAAVFIAVVVNAEDNDDEGKHNVGDDDKDKAMAVARFCCSVATPIASSEILTLVGGVVNPLLKFTVEVVDVFNICAGVVFIFFLIVDNDDDDHGNENGDGYDDDGDGDKDDDDDVMAVARLRCSMVIFWEENAPSPPPKLEKRIK